MDDLAFVTVEAVEVFLSFSPSLRWMHSIAVTTLSRGAVDAVRVLELSEVGLGPTILV